MGARHVQPAVDSGVDNGVDSGVDNGVATASQRRRNGIDSGVDSVFDVAGAAQAAVHEQLAACWDTDPLPGNAEFFSVQVVLTAVGAWA